jgi:predicted lipoprotein with Yx(FWY)xxD motif
MKNKKILVFIPILVLVLAACAPAETGATPTLASIGPIATETETPAIETATSEAPASPETPTVGVPVTGEATVNLRDTDEFGPVLVDNEGFALYMFEADSQNSGASTCYDDCAAAWPPLLTDGPPVGGEGIDDFMLATLPRDDGTTQVTYNGWPLYYYAGDTAAGNTAGQGIDGFGGLWWLISPEGEAIQQELDEPESGLPVY